MDYIITGLQQGLILVFIAYALMIPFRLLDFPDLSSEGAYPLGAAVCSSLLLLRVDPVLGLLIGSLCGGLLGITTSLIYLRFKINTLLAGIIVSTMAYSLILRLLGRPNIALFNTPSIFFPNHSLGNCLMLFFILLLLLFPLFLFFQTTLGLRLRAVGLNKAFARQWGIALVPYTMLGLFVAGCFSGLAGGLMVQMQSYMDVSMGLGIAIHGLAALMLGEAILGKDTLNKQLLAPLLGALVYQQIQGLALSIGLAPSDLKFFTGALVLFVIALQRRENHVAV